MNAVPLLPVAREEFLDAAGRYDAQAAGLGEEFIAEVGKAAERIARFPGARESVPGGHAPGGARAGVRVEEHGREEVLPVQPRTDQPLEEAAVLNGAQPYPRAKQIIERVRAR